MLALYFEMFFSTTPNAMIDFLRFVEFLFQGKHNFTDIWDLLGMNFSLHHLHAN